MRHAPWEYELEMDEEGWAPIEQLLDALQRTKKWSNICEADLNDMIEKSEKKRHELADGRIRAVYGHFYTNENYKRKNATGCFLSWHSKAFFGIH